MRSRWKVIVAVAVALGLVTGGIAVRRAARGSRVYRIGFENDPPFHFADAQGKPAGLAIDIVNEAARRAGVRLEWSFQSESSEMALRNGSVDLWPIMTIRPERKPFIYFTEPYRESEACLIVRADRAYTALADLNGLPVAYNGQPFGERMLRSVLHTAMLVAIEDPKALLEAVCRGDAQAAYMDEFTALSALMNGANCNGRPLRSIHLPAFRGQLAIGATFDAAGAADRIRAAISDMASEGRLAEMVARWSYFSGRSMELNAALIEARRRQHVMTAAALAALSLLALTAWLAFRARQQRKRAMRAEEHLQQAQRLESIGRLAGGVAHDFNNLLTVINGYAELLASDETIPEGHRAELLQVRQAGRQAASLTQQLLAFSRKQIIQPKALNLSAVVSEIRGMLQRLVGEDVDLVTALDPSLGEALADPTQIHQVLMNLVVNARDAMPSGGQLRIETSNADLDPAEAGLHGAVPGSYVRLSVSDTGLGMDADTLKHIFEPFFTTKGKGEGTGLGLSMVYGIVRQSKGWIATRSQPGKGTTFDIYLPRVASAGQVEDKAQEARSGAAGSETILLVEDQPSVRRLAARVLSGNGHQVLEAADADQALAIARETTAEIHLLLTDVVLPGLTGKDLADQLLAERPNMKVLFMSGYPEEVIADRGVLMPGIRYLAKPFRPSALAAKVREVLDEIPAR